MTLYEPTRAPAVPMKIGRRAASPLRTLFDKAKLAYSNSTPQPLAPPHTAVPVDRRYCGRFFHSQYPLRFRSWLRPPKLCFKSLATHPGHSKHFVRLFSQQRPTAIKLERPCRYVHKIAIISRICRLCGWVWPSFQAFTTNDAIPILAAR